MDQALLGAAGAETQQVPPEHRGEFPHGLSREVCGVSFSEVPRSCPDTVPSEVLGGREGG